MYYVVTGVFTYFVRQLVTEDGDRRAESREDVAGERGSDGQAVAEVVNAVAQDDHPRDGRHRVWNLLVQHAVAVAVWVAVHRPGCGRARHQDLDLLLQRGIGAVRLRAVDGTHPLDRLDAVHALAAVRAVAHAAAERRFRLSVAVCTVFVVVFRVFVHGVFVGVVR